MKTLTTLIRPLLAVLGLSMAMVLGAGRLSAEDAPKAPVASHGDSHGEAKAAHGGGDHSHAGAAPSFARVFGHRYLTAYMFCLSLCMGSLFLIFIHHLFDASWSVPVRRVAEQLSSLLFPWMAVLLVPILVLQKDIYPWLTIDPATDHALDVKKVLFNKVGFNVLLPALVLSWGLIAHTFRRWSLAQDKDGAAIWTRKSRVLAAGGIFYFALSLTLGCFYLMKSLQHQFFSTMYGVYYFAGSVWTTLVTVWVIVIWLKEKGTLAGVVHRRQVQDIGVWFFAFTVFYAYIHFSQYFLIWNAAIPEETFWYVRREHGAWKWVGFTILFGHFFVPFLTLLNQDVKLNKTIMLPMAAWAWLMHYVDMTFNVMPVCFPEGPEFSLLDPLLWFGMAGFLGFMFLKNFGSAAPYPLRDPRLKEAVTHHEIPAAGAVQSHH